MNITKHADVTHNESGMAWTVWRIQHGRNVTYKARPGKRAPRDASGAVATAEEATGMFNLSPIGPIQYTDGYVRRNKKRGILELFYVNWCKDGKYWWLEGFNRHDGHYQPSREYIRTQTEPLNSVTPSAQALIQYWESISAGRCMDRVKINVVERLSGPVHLIYGGE